LCESIGALPTILAPTAAALILTYLGGITVQGIRGLYWIQFVARIILFIYVYRNLTDIEREPRTTANGNLLADFKEVFQRGTAIKRWLLFMTLNMFTMSMLTTFRYNYAFEVKGATQFILGGFATAMLITETLFSTVIGRIADKIGRKRAFYILIPLFSLANLVLIYAPNPYWLLVAGFLMGFRMIAGFSYGSMTPELVPSDCLGRWRGLVGLMTGLAAIAAPVVGGLIWESLGPEWIFITIILLDVLIRLPLLYSVPETLKNK
jgi:MFS family permease